MHSTASIQVHVFGSADGPAVFKCDVCGCAAGLLPPPPTSAAARSPEYSTTRTLSLEADRLKQRLKRLEADGGDVEELLKQPLSASNCCLWKSTCPTTRVTQPLPNPSPIPLSELDFLRRSACCLMLARGTHFRYGVHSPLRLLVGNTSLLQRIAFLADIHPGNVHVCPPPAPPERLELQRHLRMQLCEILELRCQIAELQVERKCLERERDQAVRHAASALAATQRLQIAHEHERSQFEEQLRCTRVIVAKLEKQLSAKPLKLHRQHEMEIKSLIDEADSHRVDCLRQQEAELREYHQRAFDEREEAIAENLELQTVVLKLQSQLDRVRWTSKAGLLEQVAELHHKLREANARRTLNQRRISDANLANNRARMFQRQAVEAKEALLGYELVAEREQSAREVSLQHRIVELEARLVDAASHIERLKAVAEPPKSKFYNHGFEPVIELAAIEAMLAGASCNMVPQLFVIFARAFGVTIPFRNDKGTSVPVGKVDGKMVYEKRKLLCIPGRTHCKGLMGVLNQLHKLQVGEWLQSAENCCYISDGAESLQRDWCAHLLSRRGADGKLDLMHVDVSQLVSKASEAQAESYRSALASIAQMCKDAGVTEDISPLITAFKPVASMNDRASTARKAARLVRGAAADDDDPTCAEHALVNILEEARKAIDAILREMMQISDEQAATDAAKVKAMRTAVGWFSSPACSLIYQVSQLHALPSCWPDSL